MNEKIEFVKSKVIESPLLAIGIALVAGIILVKFGILKKFGV